MKFKKIVFTTSASNITLFNGTLASIGEANLVKITGKGQRIRLGNKYALDNSNHFYRIFFNLRYDRAVNPEDYPEWKKQTVYTWYQSLFGWPGKEEFVDGHDIWEESAPYITHESNIKFVSEVVEG